MEEIMWASLRTILCTEEANLRTKRCASKGSSIQVTCMAKENWSFLESRPMKASLRRVKGAEKALIRTLKKGFRMKECSNSISSMGKGS